MMLLFIISCIGTSASHQPPRHECKIGKCDLDLRMNLPSLVLVPRKIVSLFQVGARLTTTRMMLAVMMSVGRSSCIQSVAPLVPLVYVRLLCQVRVGPPLSRGVVRSRRDCLWLRLLARGEQIRIEMESEIALLRACPAHR